MKTKLCAVLLVFTMVFSATALAHSGRTDGQGGHNDNKNASGLGSYHFHHGMGPHLHPNGVCPYAGDQQAAKPSATQRPASSQVQETRVPSSAKVVVIANPTPRAATIPPEILDDREPLYGKTNANNVNIRQSPSTNSKRVTQIAKKGTALEIIESIITNSGEEWYCIWLDEEEVYMLGKFIDIITMEEYLDGE